METWVGKRVVVDWWDAKNWVGLGLNIFGGEEVGKRGEGEEEEEGEEGEKKEGRARKGMSEEVLRMVKEEEEGVEGRGDKEGMSEDWGLMGIEDIEVTVDDSSCSPSIGASDSLPPLSSTPPQQPQQHHQHHYQYHQKPAKRSKDATLEEKIEYLQTTLTKMKKFKEGMWGNLRRRHEDGGK